jgi:hypothetical protein
VKHWIRKCLYAAVVLVVVLLGFLVIEHFRGKARLIRYKTKLAAAGEKLLVKDLLIPVLPEDNGFPLLLSQLKALPPWDPNSMVPFARRLQHGKAIVSHKESMWLDSAPQPKTNTWAALEDWMSENESGINALRSALEAKSFDSNPDYSLGYGIKLVHLATLKRGAQVLATGTLVELHHGKFPEALIDLRALYSCSRALRNEPLVISQLVRVAISDMAIVRTWECLQASGWEESQLAEIQQMLSSESFIHEMVRALEMERILADLEFERFRASNKAAADTLNLIADFEGGILNFKGLPEESGAVLDEIMNHVRKFGFRNFYVPFWRFAWMHQDHANALETAQAVVAATRETETAHSYMAFKSVSKTWPSPDDKPSVYDRWRYAFSSAGKSEFITSVLKAAQAEVYRSLALSAVAIKRYELKSHKLPGRLEELVPNFLARVPDDFFDGKPLRYRSKQGLGFVLYSVNADGIDNGGDPEPVDHSSRIMWSGRDAVWPEPATAQEIRDFYLKDNK